MSKDVMVRFKYRDEFKGTHKWQQATQSHMMDILRNTSVVWVVVQNLETGEMKQCTSSKLNRWTRVPDAVHNWFDDDPRQEYWKDPDDPGYKYPKPIQKGYNEAFDGSYAEWKQERSIVDLFIGDDW